MGGLGVPTFDMPEPKRENFSSDEQYERAVDSMTKPPSGDEGSVLNVTDEDLRGVLLALTINAKAVGMGVLHEEQATVENLTAEVDRLIRFGRPRGRVMLDYVIGRLVKVTLSQNDDGTWWFNTRHYNDHYGIGAAEDVVFSHMSQIADTPPVTEGVGADPIGAPDPTPPTQPLCNNLHITQHGSWRCQLPAGHDGKHGNGKGGRRWL